METTYQAGNFLRICDRCGEKRYASMTMKEWTGHYVCKDTCVDVRNPQDLLRARMDVQTVPMPRPDHPVFTGFKVDDPHIRIDARREASIDRVWHLTDGYITTTGYFRIDDNTFVRNSEFLSTNEVTADSL